MSRLPAWLTLASDVLVLASRRRVLWIYLLLSSAVVAVLIGATQLEQVGESSWRVNFAGAVELKPVEGPAELVHPALLRDIALTVFVVVGIASLFGVGLALLATIGAVSRALTPGTAEMVFSRPVSRAEVVLSRFAGALAFALLQAEYLALLLFVLAGVVHGAWYPRFLLLGPALMPKFAVLLAIGTLGAVVTRSQILGLLAAGGAWLTSYAVNMTTIGLTEAGGAPGLQRGALWARRLLPQISHQDELAARALEKSLDVSLLDPTVVAAQAVVWVALPLLLTLLVVRRRDL